MISPHAVCTIRRIPLARLTIHEVRARSLAWVAHYADLLLQHPDDDAGFLIVSRRPNGTYCVLDGQTRYLALVIAGRGDALCIVVDERGGNDGGRFRGSP